MLSVRRLWLLPSISIVLLLYFMYFSAQPQIKPLNDNQNVHLRPGQPERHPVASYAKLPSGVAHKFPRIQHVFPASETLEQQSERLKRKAVIKEAFLHSWQGYKKYAWMQDEVAPLSGAYRNPYGGWAATLVDSMDTLWIMGLKSEFEICVDAIKKIDFTANSEEVVNVFETVIRHLGGFLSAYDVSGHQYPALLEKAVELANILYMTFDTPNRIPLTRWPWKVSAAGQPIVAARKVLIAEIGSMSLEFTRLSQLTGDPKWFDAIDRLTKLLYDNQDKTNIPGLWPTIIDAENELFSLNHFTLGGMADSTTEYLPKQDMMLAGLDPRYSQMYDKAFHAASQHLFYRPLVPDDHDILFSGNAGLESQKVVTESQGQHLTCFIGGMVGVAARIYDRPQDLNVAQRLVKGCIWSYNTSTSGLMPETFHLASCHIGTNDSPHDACKWSQSKWYQAVARQQASNPALSNDDLAAQGRELVEKQALLPGYTNRGDNRYILRPEAIESVFIMYRITGDRFYQEAAWTMWNSINKACKTSLAYAGISNVLHAKPLQSDRMESFWLAETLKYFYLIFSDPNDWSLDEWVLTTEAHLLRRPKPDEPLPGAVR